MEKCSPCEVESDEQDRLRSLYEGMEFIDDVYQGEVLDHDMVRKARRVEIDFFRTCECTTRCTSRKRKERS